jgi:hypothetical protein
MATYANIKKALKHKTDEIQNKELTKLVNDLLKYTNQVIKAHAPKGKAPIFVKDKKEGKKHQRDAVTPPSLPDNDSGNKITARNSGQPPSLPDNDSGNKIA